MRIRSSYRAITHIQHCILKHSNCSFKHSNFVFALDKRKMQHYTLWFLLSNFFALFCFIILPPALCLPPVNLNLDDPGIQQSHVILFALSSENRPPACFFRFFNDGYFRSYSHCRIVNGFTKPKSSSSSISSSS